MRLTLIAAVLGGLAACALQADLTQSAPDPRAVLDAYLIAHGMASEYASREGADPAVIAQLERLDARAAAAIRVLEQGRGTGGETEVSALADYAARQAVLAR